MNKNLTIALGVMLFCFAGCGTIIKKEEKESSLTQAEKEDEEQEKETVTVKVLISLPPLRMINYPYDINGFPHKSSENHSDGTFFLIVSY